MNKTPRHGVSLPPSTRSRLQALIEQLGEYRAAEVVGVGYPSLVRAAGGFGIRRGTARAIEVALGSDGSSQMQTS